MIKKGLFLGFLFYLIIAPISGYVTYVSTGSILLSCSVVTCLIVLWKFTFGGGLKKRRKFVDKLLLKGFSLSKENPLFNFSESINKDWKKGVGYTDDQDQPMCVKATERGIILFYFCRASKGAFEISWEDLTQVNLIEHIVGDKKHILARLFSPGLGMKVFIPWSYEFNKYVPERIAYFRVRHD